MFFFIPIDITGGYLMGNTNPGKSRNCFRAKCGVCNPPQPARGGDGDGDAGVGSGKERGLPCSVSNITYKYVCQATPARTDYNGDNDTSAQRGDGQDTSNGK